MLDFILLICTAIILFFIACLVFFISPKNKINQYYFSWMFFLVTWILSNYFENEPRLRNYGELLLKIDFASAILLGLFFYFFCLNFPQAIFITLRKQVAVYFLPVILSIL